jgi:hypothetical protein
MPIETVEASAWRHMDVARDAIDMERTRRMHALAPGESISFVDSPQRRHAQSAVVSAAEVQSQPVEQTGEAQQAADAAQSEPGTLTGVLDLSANGSNSGATALLAANNASALEVGNAAAANRDVGDLANRANDEDGDRSGEAAIYGSESRWWEAEWDARMRAYDAQYSALSAFRGSVSQGYLDYANEMTLAFLQPPTWEDYVAEVGLEDQFALSEPMTDTASADEGFGSDDSSAEFDFGGLINEILGVSKDSSAQAGGDSTTTQDGTRETGSTERDQQGIDQSDEILFKRGDELAETNGLNPRGLANGSIQYPHGRIRTPGGEAITEPAQNSAPVSAYPSQYRHVAAAQGAMPVGGFENLTPAPDLPPLPPEATPILADGRHGSSVPYRDQAGQVFYAAYDADGRAVRWLSAAPAAAMVPTAAAHAARALLTAEIASGAWPLAAVAGVTLVGTTWLIAQGKDGTSSREPLTPDQVRDGQRGMINVPVSPGPGGTPGNVTDESDTSTPVLQPPDLLPPLTTTLPIAEQWWRDLIIEAGGSWSSINESTDPNVVQQSTPTSCGPACAQMLLGDRGIAVDQSAFGDSLTSAHGLAAELNSVDGGWIGAGVEPSSLVALTRTGSWSAMMWEPGAHTGHWVVVEGISPEGLVNIRDPFDATRYKMNQSDFVKSWSGYSVFKP